ncbi:hypothetical protein ADL25_37125 [Streptomyces sp. NRRL F-5122]|uniref:SulP family inorganic anion transporter n=1 Tax=unclassified Streptomyces TaxID=2593676 RepID=UPI000740E8E5|nr:hypothetical protein ADL25_37125 [Streptomyces sp. NRRL F-5122]
MVAFALIASAQSLFSAAAVDRLHRGKRTDYDRELMAQGWGTRSAGCSARCPMTAVIVHIAANVRAGARTKASRVLHRVWLLVFTVTAVVIAVGNLFEGVLIGLVLAVARTAWDISHVHVETEDLGAACAAAIEGWAAARGQEAVATTRYTS